jgi:hypothetical protein
MRKEKKTGLQTDDEGSSIKDPHVFYPICPETLALFYIFTSPL